MEENKQIKDEKYIDCQNKECKNNKDGKCIIFTEIDLINHRTCGEREF